MMRNQRCWSVLANPISISSISKLTESRAGSQPAISPPGWAETMFSRTASCPTSAPCALIRYSMLMSPWSKVSAFKSAERNSPSRQKLDYKTRIWSQPSWTATSIQPLSLSPPTTWWRKAFSLLAPNLIKYFLSTAANHCPSPSRGSPRDRVYQCFTSQQSTTQQSMPATAKWCTATLSQTWDQLSISGTAISWRHSGHLL